jgi:nitrogen regulatory protein P-II 1
MRKIEAIVEHKRLDDIRKSLLSLGVTGMTVTEVRDYGAHKSHKEIYRGDTYDVDALVRVKIETVVPQNLVPKTLSILTVRGRNGGHDKIHISTVNDVSS